MSAELLEVLQSLCPCYSSESFCKICKNIEFTRRDFLVRFDLCEHSVSELKRCEFSGLPSHPRENVCALRISESNFLTLTGNLSMATFFRTSVQPSIWYSTTKTQRPLLGTQKLH